MQTPLVSYSVAAGKVLPRSLTQPRQFVRTQRLGQCPQHQGHEGYRRLAIGSQDHGSFRMEVPRIQEDRILSGIPSSPKPPMTVTPLTSTMTTDVVPPSRYHSTDVTVSGDVNSGLEDVPAEPRRRAIEHQPLRPAVLAVGAEVAVAQELHAVAAGIGISNALKNARITLSAQITFSL